MNHSQPFRFFYDQINLPAGQRLLIFKPVTTVVHASITSEFLSFFLVQILLNLERDSYQSFNQCEVR